MKKIGLLLAASLTIGGVVPNLSANAENEYMPTLYFNADENDDARKLKSGTIYINNSELNEDIKLVAGVFIDDKHELASFVKVKWKCESEFIKFSNIIDPISVFGKSPYSEFTKSGGIALSTNADEKFQSVLYNLGLSQDVFTFTGDKSDDYPLAGFEATIDRAIQPGRYDIHFVTGQRGNGCDILYHINEKDIVEVFPEGKYAENLNIAVSDRKLGDVNNSGKVDATDATAILSEYADLSAGKTGSFDIAQTVSADIDGNGLISSADAASVLSYYAYLSAGGDLELLDYLN